MFDIKTKEINWGGRTLKLETGHIARQSLGAVVATYGNTVVLCTVNAAKEANPDMGFFPLTVQYQEKSYAVGKIPGGFLKRESRPTDNMSLISRLIDRPVRPLFHPRFKNEVQIICTVLSHDMENYPDVLAMIGSSAALAISGLPFMDTLAGARVGYINDEFVLNPTVNQMEESKLELVVAGTEHGVMMVESEAKELSEKVMLDAVTFGKDQFQPVINAIREFASDVNPVKWEVPQASESEIKFYENVAKKAEAGLREAYKIKNKQERSSKISEVKSGVLEAVSSDENFSDLKFGSAFKTIEMHIVRGDVIKTGLRIDGRDTKTVRPIRCEIGLLPMTHGSALFTRGETQALVITTLGTGQDEQMIDQLEGEYRERFMLHYNFPPYSVGEVGRMGAPGRREIGHGKLAWRAVRPLLPSKDDFPYTLRVVSEITESNGSSSMATVCGTSLALMDAGVPIEKAVAGIAMGLIKEEKDFAVLTDILGDEDHLGDMDFKVAGTLDGVTALQMDIKIGGITKEIMEIALDQAKDGRIHILGEMKKVIDTSRTEISSNAPRMHHIQVPKEKIGEIIGPGGKNIRDICETTGVKIDIDETGMVTISAVNQDSVDAAIKRIEVYTIEPEMDKIYPGKVVKILDGVGAITEFMGSKSGLVHISQLSAQRVEKVENVVKVGDSVFVKVAGFDKGKIRLTMKDVDQTTGNLIAQ